MNFAASRNQTIYGSPGVVLPGYQTSGLLLECCVVRKFSKDCIVSADLGLIKGFNLVAPVDDMAECREGI